MARWCNGVSIGVFALKSVNEMANPASIANLGSEFDAFLFAPIGEEANGMLLSVVSALARLDIDPWQEAAQLARLPEAMATQRLTSLIAAIPDAPPPQRDPGRIAARLIALLPHVTVSSAARSTLSSGGIVANRSPALVWAILLAFMFGSQWIASSLHPPAPVADAQASTSSVTPASRPSLPTAP
jgi:hypothetical protein